MKSLANQLRRYWALAVPLLLIRGNVVAETRTYVGNELSAWSVSSNWSDNTSPTIFDNALVDNGFGPIVTESASVDRLEVRNVSSLVVEPTATLLITEELFALGQSEISIGASARISAGEIRAQQSTIVLAGGQLLASPSILGNGQSTSGGIGFIVSSATRPPVAIQGFGEVYADGYFGSTAPIRATGGTGTSLSISTHPDSRLNFGPTALRGHEGRSSTWGQLDVTEDSTLIVSGRFATRAISFPQPPRPYVDSDLVVASGGLMQFNTSEEFEFTGSASISGTLETIINDFPSQQIPRYRIGGEFQIENGGSVVSNALMMVSEGGRISGNATLTGVYSLGGVISPGGPNDLGAISIVPGPWDFQVSSPSYAERRPRTVIGDGSILEITLGNQAGQSDTISIEGEWVFGYTLSDDGRVVPVFGQEVYPAIHFSWQERVPEVGTYKVLDFSEPPIWSGFSPRAYHLPDQLEYDFSQILVDGTLRVLLKGDFNVDGIVDGADYTVWRDNLGTLSVTPYTLGDANGDSKVDAADYAVWRSNFGNVVSSSLTGAGFVAVPEPSALVLTLAGLLLGSVVRNY